MTNTNNNRDCSSCSYCYSCSYCSVCYSCSYCSVCSYCSYCSYCSSCYVCSSCSSCSSCYVCSYCSSCSSCSYCYSCSSCSYCYSCSSCYYSSGLRMSENMIFCLGEGMYEKSGVGYQKSYGIFNQFPGKKEWEEIRTNLPECKIPITHWVDSENMTDQEKKDKPIYREIGGYLKVLSYKEAWKQWWGDASEIDRQKVLSIPHFNAEIFKGITGIEVKNGSGPREVTMAEVEAKFGEPVLIKKEEV